MHQVCGLVHPGDGQAPDPWAVDEHMLLAARPDLTRGDPADLLNQETAQVYLPTGRPHASRPYLVGYPHLGYACSQVCFREAIQLS